MNTSELKLTCDQVRSMDMVNYLYTLGHTPKKIRRNEYWYLSPLHTEKTASFKINRSINRWYDFGIGKGGNLIDFAILYHHCSIAELLQSLQGNFSFHPAPFNKAAIIDSSYKIQVVQSFNISSFGLINYLKERKIPFEIADQYCREVRFQLNEKIYYSIGFKNDAGGFELRNPYCKTSSSPKGITTIKNGATRCAVFEGFFDFLSFLVLVQNESYHQWDFCILNSLSFFENARPFLEQHSNIHLFLDNDTAGQNCSHHAMQMDKRYVDESILYSGYKDLNEWIMNMGKPVKTNDPKMPP